jgi:small-conductance mechanosensitive channel
METLSVRFREIWAVVSDWLTSPQFYIQLGAIAAATGLALVIALLIRSRTAIFKAEPDPGPWMAFRRVLFKTRTLLFPILTVLLLGVASDVGTATFEQSWLIRVAQSLVVVFLLYTVVARFIGDSLISNLLKWVGIPLATLHVFGWLDDVTGYLDSLSIQIGNIQLSLFAIGRTVFFGIILFWLGRISSSTGKRVIRSHPRLDVGAREVLAKLFEISLFVAISLVLLQVMGIGLTALTVFGGAFGIGLGLGLQRVAANFISGIIILLDRSMTLDDYIELEDGRAGRLRELNMRSATLETFDGKDIVVPNETFVSTAFTNWTHHGEKQRYDLTFSVAYSTDLPRMLDIVRGVVGSHPQVLSGPDVPKLERPDAEIESFGDYAINILVEFWMVGIDDGVNRVGADLRLMIWSALKEHDIEVPFPQREISIVSRQGSAGGSPSVPRR